MRRRGDSRVKAPLVVCLSLPSFKMNQPPASFPFPLCRAEGWEELSPRTGAPGLRVRGTQGHPGRTAKPTGGTGDAQALGRLVLQDAVLRPQGGANLADPASTSISNTASNPRFIGETAGVQESKDPALDPEHREGRRLYLLHIFSPAPDAWCSVNICSVNKCRNIH